MIEEFERLPIRGLEITRVEGVFGRFVSLMLNGIVSRGSNHFVVDYSLQFNQIINANISTAFATNATIVDLSASKLSSTTCEYRISFGQVSMKIHANSFACSLVRDDRFLEEDEKRWALVNLESAPR